MPPAARGAACSEHTPITERRATRRLTAAALDPLGELDDQTFGSADVAEEEGVLVVDDATHVVDLEGDVPEPRTVRGRRRLLSAGGRRVEAHHLEHVAAVRSANHHELDRHVLQTNDPIDPLAAEHAGLAAVQAEQRKKADRLVEILDDETDVDETGDTGVIAVH